MTCAIAVRAQGRVVIGADRRVAALRLSTVRKLHRMPCGAYVALSGALGRAQGLILKAQDQGWGPTELAQALLATEQQECDFLWATPGGSLFEVSSCGATVSQEVAGIGSGADSALGYLAGAPTPKTLRGLRSSVRRAIEYAGTVHMDVGGPIDIVLV